VLFYEILKAVANGLDKISPMTHGISIDFFEGCK
jgi:hypothetical protein